MLTMNHTITRFYSLLLEEGNERAEKLIKQNVSVLLLPDAIRMYGPRQVFHFTEHPYTGKISSVVLNTTPDNLKGIKSSLKTNLQADIPRAAIDELSHIDVFKELNPDWVGSEYETHLKQDIAWDKWIREMVDVSRRFEDTFVYRKTGTVVNGETFRKELFPLDDLFFLAVAKKIKEEYGIVLNQDWFEKNIHQSLLRDYDEELAENTWKYINIPAMDKDIKIPEFLDENYLDIAIQRMLEASK